MTTRIPPEAIHGAAISDEALTALPPGIARAAGAQWAMIQWRHTDGVHELIASNRHARDCQALYAWKYAPVDPWLKAALAAPRRDELLPMDDYVPRPAFEKSRLYREFLRPQGDDTVHAAVAVFPTAWGEGFLSLHRGREQGPFAPSDLAPLQERLLHLGCVVRARGELAAGRRRGQVKRDELDGLGLGAVVVSGEGRVARVNLAADQVLRRADGFTTRDGRLSCIDLGSRFRLQAALALAAAQDDPRATAIPVERVLTGTSAARGRRRPLAYMVSVTPARSESAPPRAMLVFRDPDAGDQSLSARLRALLRPARAEPALATPLMQGVVY